nr:TPM domain-containing protein [Panacagrimonas sp.]
MGLLLGLFWLPQAQVKALVEIPEFVPNVVDPSGFLDPLETQRVNAELERIRGESEIWGAVYVVDTLAGESIEAVAERAFRKWQLGQRGVDNGLLLVLAMNDRRSRFEVGYGLEGTITDVAARMALDVHLAPKMRIGDEVGGIIDAFGYLSDLATRDPAAVRELRIHSFVRVSGQPNVEGTLAILTACLSALWLYRPLRNRTIAYLVAKAQQDDPTLPKGKPWTDPSGPFWEVFNDVSTGMPMIAFSIFSIFLAVIMSAAPPVAWLGLPLPWLLAGVILWANTRRYRAPASVRVELEDAERRRAALIAAGHIVEMAPGRYAYTAAYRTYQKNLASVATRSSSAGSNASPSPGHSSSSISSRSSSGGGRSGGGGASSRW